MAKAKNSEIFWDKFKRLASKGENEILIYVFFEINKRNLILIWIKDFIYKSKAKFLLPTNVDTTMSCTGVKWRFRVKNNRVVHASWENEED